MLWRIDLKYPITNVGCYLLSKLIFKAKRIRILESFTWRVFDEMGEEGKVGRK